VTVATEDFNDETEERWPGGNGVDDQRAYLLPRCGAGARLGHAEVKDHMFLDGLEDAYGGGR
jgi:acetyl-CoA C-acetyltransferase